MERQSIWNVTEKQRDYLLEVLYGDRPHYIRAISEATYMNLPDTIEPSVIFTKALLTHIPLEAHRFSVERPRLPKYTPGDSVYWKQRKRTDLQSIQDIAKHYQQLLPYPMRMLTVEQVVTTCVNVVERQPLSK